MPHCPTCARRVGEQWLICPTCRTRLNRVCPNCNRLVGLDWSLCAWCGKDFERRDPVAAMVGATPAPYPVAAAAAASAVEPPVITTVVDGDTARSRRSPRATNPRPARPAADPLPER